MPEILQLKVTKGRVLLFLFDSHSQSNYHYFVPSFLLSNAFSGRIECMGCYSKGSGCELVLSFLHQIPQWKRKRIQWERSAGTVHLFCCHLRCPAPPNFLWPEAVCWPVAKKKKSFWMGMLKINFTHVHTHTDTHPRTHQSKSFDFWLYTPFVQLRFYGFDLSLMSNTLDKLWFVCQAVFLCFMTKIQ